jgi:hypothetical protein
MMRTVEAVDRALRKAIEITPMKAMAIITSIRVKPRERP